MDGQSTSPLPYSEEWWRVALSSIGDAVIVTDNTGKVAFMNPVAEFLTKWTNKEAKGKLVTDILSIAHGSTGIAVENPVRKVIETGFPFQLAKDTVLLTRGGTEVFIDDNAAPIKGADGSVFGVVLVFRDISQQKRAQAAQLQLAAITESSNDAIVREDTKGIILTWNRGAEAIYGYTDEIIGQHISILAPPDRKAELEAIENRILRGERIDHFETVRQKKDGTRIDVSLSASAIQDDQGRTIGISKIARDITARKRAEAERAYLAAIVESSDDAIVGKTLDSVITSWNRAAEKLFGYTAGEAIGKTVYIIIPRDRYNEEIDILARLRRGERIEHFETIRQKKDGSLIDVSLTISPIKDTNGKIIGASKIARDISERKKAESQLREEREALEIINRVGGALSSELDLQKLVQTLTDAATTVTGAAFGSFFYNGVNEHGASYMLYTLSGAPHERFEGFPMPRSTELFDPTFRGEGVIRLDDVKEDPRYAKNPPYWGMPKGHLPVTSYLAVPVRSQSAEVLGGLFLGHPQPGVFTERHERIVAGLAGQAANAIDNARLYSAMRKARKEAETANRLKDEFLATVSHELRTPLNAILGWARILHSGKLDEETRDRAIETIQRNAISQGQIIEDILDVSRIITGKLRLDISLIEVSRPVEDAIESVRPTAEAKGVRLETIIDRKPNLVRADSHRLQQVFWNLLSNAIKFTPKGGRIQVSVSRIDSQVEIVVSDTGQGIRREFLPHVFDRFSQAEGSTVRTHGGLGLGLAIVRHITELHAGTVTAASEGEGKGAAFTVRLPVAIMQETRGRKDPQSGLVPVIGSALSVALQPELMGLRILVVDDEADARELMAEVLKQSGAEFRLASSTAEALAVFKEWKPDVIVSDIGMPGADGYDLIRQIRSLPHKEGGTIPAAALTAYATAEDRLKVLTAGFQIHVAKPVEPLELVAVVVSLAGRAGKTRR